jgi:hypothetical protein
LIHVPSGEFGVPLWPHDRGFSGSFRKLGDIVFDVEPMDFPSRNVGGEFVENVPITGLLSKLDAGAPTTDGFLEVGYGFPEKKAEKIPMGFDSKKSFAKMDEDSNVVD